VVKLPHWPVPHERSNIELGLGRTLSLLKELGNPHLKLPPVIHIAGTNGKGSTVAFLKAIFEAAGYKTHTYTSPHLVRYNERIKILGTDISDEYLYEIIEECRIAAEKIGLNITFFEGTTVAAFLAFSKVPADIVILETGLGGRLDASNVIEKPLASIITSISLDHMDFLGSDVYQIAFEKAGIMKKNSPCIISKQYDEVYQALEQRAAEIGCETITFEYDFLVEKIADGFRYKSQQRVIDLPMPKLIGDHQLINAGNAITAAINSGFNISDHNIAEGLQKVEWPARLQKLISGPIVDLLPSHSEIWVDGAHNEAGSYVLSSWLRENLTLPTYLIYGTTKGRDCKVFLQNFTGLTKRIMAVPIDAEPLSYSEEHIAKIALSLDFPTSCCSSIEEAIEEIVKLESHNFRILVCGSLYLAGDVLFKNQKMRV